MVPTYGGVAIFGADCNIVVADNPRDEQRSAFFGLQGVERKDGGFRGRVAICSGVLQGPGVEGLAFAEVLFRSYNDGVPRTLVDTLGLVWPNMKLASFEPQGRAMTTPYGYCIRSYTARFESPI